MSRTMPTECEHGQIVDWGDFGPEDDATPPECVDCTAEATTAREQTIRAQALQSAASWLPVTDGEDELLATAERFAHWIASGERSA